MLEEESLIEDSLSPNVFHIRLFHKTNLENLDFDLIDIIRFIEDIHKRKWLFYYEFEDDIPLKSDLSISDLLKKIKAHKVSGNCYLLDGQKLFSVSEEIFQTVFLTLISVRNEIKKPDVHLLDYSEVLSEFQVESAEIEIRAVDSSYFEVLTEDQQLIEKLKENFVQYEVLI